jgi:hypothetical protein
VASTHDSSAHSSSTSSPIRSPAGGEPVGEQRAHGVGVGDERVALADRLEQVQPGVVGQRGRGQPQLDGGGQRVAQLHGGEHGAAAARLLVVEHVRLPRAVGRPGRRR